MYNHAPDRHSVEEAGGVVTQITLVCTCQAMSLAWGVSAQTKGCLFQVVTHKKLLPKSCVCLVTLTEHLLLESLGAPMEIMGVDFVLLLLEYKIHKGRDLCCRSYHT